MELQPGVFVSNESTEDWEEDTGGALSGLSRHTQCGQHPGCEYQ